MSFSRYLALGDSVSIDLYPALDLGETDVAVALERVPGAGKVAPVGAASLLYHNSEEHWPEDVGNDLLSYFPELEHRNLAQDGASIGDVFGEQLPQVESSDEETLVTLTIGAYDLFSAYSGRPKRTLREHIVRDIAEAYEFLLDAIRRLLPRAVLVLSTIYDPSDRTGRIPGMEEAGRLQLDALDQLNAHIRRLAGGTPSARLGDIYAHFLGHGASAAEEDRWFWRRSMTEPNARGASEIRHVWLGALAPDLAA